MNRKENLQRASVDACAKLVRLAMRLQRAPDESVPELVAKAREEVRRIEVARKGINDAGEELIAEGEDAIDNELQDVMASLGQVTAEAVAPHGFFLMVPSPMPDVSQGSLLNYKSNMHPDTVYAYMQQFCAAHERAEANRISRGD